MSITKSILELFSEEFFIPKYQRGYRWTEAQVLDLLNDVKRFKCSDGDWYCLQPLVVKKKDGRWNVVDGQQRLTTISLIFHYINSQYVSTKPNIHIKYETRANWESVLSDPSQAGKNIDFFHIAKAYDAIKSWFQHEGDIESIMETRLKENCQFIWFDMDESCIIKDYAEEKLFLDLNKGKIKLTNAELVKALFLNSENFKSYPNLDDIKRKQNEISVEWDMIEEMFNSDNEELWNFINGDGSTKGSKIELLFDLMAEKCGEESDENMETYKFFQNRFEEAENLEYFVCEEWEYIKSLADKIRYWYGNKELYHKIGYILFWSDSRVSKRNKLLKIIKESENNEDKFLSYLDGEIRNIIRWNGKDDLYKGNDDPQIRRVLLLHNIITLNNQTNESARFSFKDYIKLKFDLEHINPSAEEEPTKETEKKDWMREEAQFVSDPELRSEMTNFNSYGNSEDEKNRFSALYRKVLSYYTQNTDKTSNDDISNIVLLDSKTNSAYKNWSFVRKRKFLFDRDRDGVFIPVCTKKAFNKQYTEDIIPNMTYWSENDKKAYLEDIKKVLSHYFN